jgi:hypothetical protein
MNRFTDTDINELNKLLENDTNNKYLFFVRPCYENHSPYTALAFYIIYLDQTVLTTTIILMICI